MELTNQFKVNVPVEQAWGILTDVERIAPCLPGAELQEIDGNEYRGVVKVKVGPITAQYKGKATFVEQDESAHRAVLRAEGRETRGQGNASATITATLQSEGDATQVSVVTDLTITGRVAQFGRGVLADVSNKLMGQFVDSLEAMVAASGTPAGDGAAAPGGEPAATPGGEAAGDATAAAGDAATPAGNGGTAVAREVTSAPAASVDLLKVAGPAVLKRIVPATIAAVLFVVPWLLRRLRRKPAA